MTAPMEQMAERVEESLKVLCPYCGGKGERVVKCAGRPTCSGFMHAAPGPTVCGGCNGVGRVQPTIFDVSTVLQALTPQDWAEGAVASGGMVESEVALTPSLKAVHSCRSERCGDGRCDRLYRRAQEGGEA